MRSKVVRLLLLLAVIEMIAIAIGKTMSEKMSSGDERSNEFRLASFFGGKKFESHADNFTSGTVVTSMGGIDLDLRDATLSERGADLDLTATVGGIRVIVPAEWAVDIESEAMAGGFDARVTPAEDMPDTAPKLRVHAVARMGGIQVTTEE